MAWVTPRTWTTGELVTAALLNTHLRDNLSHLGGTAGLTVDDTVTGFTNTAYADMDALTTDQLNAPVAVTVTTMTTALVMISARTILQNTAGTCLVSYRISGATTRASDDDFAINRAATTGNSTGTFVHAAVGLTAGSNTFEMQAKVSGNSATIQSPTITVIPLST